MPPKGPQREHLSFAIDDDQRQRIDDTLGPSPQDALSALVGYGLNDRDIATYLKLPVEVVAALRRLWGIPPNI